MRLYIIVFILLTLTACGGGGSDENTTTPIANKSPTLLLTSSAGTAGQGESITFTAQATDSDGTIASYQWQQISGTIVKLTDDASTNLTIIAPQVSVEESLTIALTVKDNDGASIQKSVAIQIIGNNAAPDVSIESSHLNAPSGKNVILTANVTDEDVASVTYLWQKIKGPELTLSDISLPEMSFVAPNVMSTSELVLSLQVTDSAGQSNTAQISVTILPENSTPPAIYPISDGVNLMTSDQTYLSVSATDGDGEVVSYQWRQIAGVDLAFEDKGVATLSITAPELDIHQQVKFEITATDNDGLSSTATLSVNLFPRYQMTTVQGRTDGKGVDLVILAEGFSQDELPLFEQAVNDFIQAFSQEETITKHLPAWNFHRIDSISQQSGADFPEDNVYVDTVFDSYFQCRNTARLLCVDDAKVLAVTAKIAPQFDQVIVVVNSSTYGGAGGQVATFSLAQSATDIAIHELGHSFAGLADEYTYGATDDSIYEPNEPNVTTKTDPNEVKWKHWFDDINDIPTQAGETGVGLFEGARYHAKNYYRPLNTSIMKELAQPFGVVNAEAWALNVYATAGSIFSVEPANEFVNHVSGTSLSFLIDPIQGQAINKITWRVNDIEQESDVGFPEKLTISSAPSASYKVTVEITDNSGVIKQDSQQRATTSYSWSVTAQ